MDLAFYAKSSSFSPLKNSLSYS